MIVIAVLSLPFLFVIARRPVLRRLAVRNAVRRPREAVLVVLGSLLGTAIMTGSFVMGDTFDASIRATAYQQLGPIDEVVAVLGLEQRQALDERLAGFTSPDVDGMLSATRSGAAVATAGASRRASPKAQLLEVDFADARRFGGDPDATGIEGGTPAVGEAVVVDDLARKLRVAVGDEIDAFAYGSSVRLRVTRVIDQQGVAGFWMGRESSSYNVFVAPGTIAGLQAAAPVGAPAGEPPLSLVFVSNRGSVESGDALSDDVKSMLEAELEGMFANVDTVKSTVLAAAEENGKQLTQLYTSLGTFAVLAGVLLLVNIFFMLADERKSELGMLRALGLRRSSLVGAFATEGWFYALVAAVVGTFAGLGLGRVMMFGASRVFGSGPEEFRLTLRWSAEGSSIEQGMATGFLISIATVLLTSVWLGRFNIIRAIRDIAEPERRRPRKRALYAGLVAASLGLLLTVTGVQSAAFAPIVIGPVAVIVGVGPALARSFPRERVATTLAFLALAWGTVSVPVAVALDTDVNPFLFVLQGLILVGSAVLLVTLHQRTIGHAIAHVANRSLPVRLGLAYPLAKRVRTAMTLGMFSLVIFILVYVSAISAMFEAQVDEFTADSSGGFDVIVTSNPSNPVPFDELADAEGVRGVAPIVTLPTDVIPAGATDPTRWLMSAFDERLLAGGPPALDERGDYADDAAVYQALLDNPDLAIVDDFFLSDGAGPPEAQLDIGDRFTITDPVSGRSRTLEVAAIGANDWLFNGGLMGIDAARDVFGERAVASRAYVAVDGAEAFADAVSGRYLERGGEGKTIRAIVGEFLSQQQQFFMLMRAYLALGLVVGIAGIGVIMVRAVRERRRQVGVLRALGFEANAVRSAFVIESAFVAIEGVLVGVALAFVTSYSITLTSTFGDMQWTIPFFAIFVLVVGTFVFALLATAGPARAAARIRPAVALRIAD